jgi:hypothetical protein
MRTDTTPRVTITWAQLRAALAELGYTWRQTDTAQIYHEPTTNTLLLFPLRADSDRVELHHLFQARRNTDFKGVADEAEFDRVLYRTLDAVPDHASVA